MRLYRRDDQFSGLLVVMLYGVPTVVHVGQTVQRLRRPSKLGGLPVEAHRLGFILRNRFAALLNVGQTIGPHRTPEICGFPYRRMASALSWLTPSPVSYRWPRASA